ncbi:MAG: DNA mismatch repair protein MutS, partial [Humidesulfovibrio sp.]|nr:DNA mismatch repair protein MutS [Humidesulfovibrio sp.]
KSLEYRLFNELRDKQACLRARFMFMAGGLAGLDNRQGLAEAARQNDWNRPELHEGIETEIIQGRHPMVEAASGAANYIPNDLRLDETRRILLITGPNMAGKSTVLRQAALITILAQMGSFVPAKSARLGLADRVFSRVGASDNLARGQSTFMVEMMETARILRQATSRSLVILDEIGRGTSTFDGLALAWAVVEELSRRGRGQVRTLFATHYFELTCLEGRIPGLRNLNIAVREWKGDIVFLRKLVPGPADKSYGIEVARLAGVPQGVVQRAREILASLEEKSQSERGGASQAILARQSLLPGLPTQVPNQEPKAPEPESPVLVELRRLDLNGLSPLAALTLLHEWKKSVT